MPKYAIREVPTHLRRLSPEERQELDYLNRRIAEEAGEVRTYRLDPRVPEGFYLANIRGKIGPASFRIHRPSSFYISNQAVKDWDPKHMRANVYSDDSHRIAFVSDPNGQIRLYYQDKQGAIKGNSIQLFKLCLSLGAEMNVSYAARVEGEALIIDFRQRVR